MGWIYGCSFEAYVCICDRPFFHAVAVPQNKPLKILLAFLQSSWITTRGTTALGWVDWKLWCFAYHYTTLRWCSNLTRSNVSIHQSAEEGCFKEPFYFHLNFFRLDNKIHFCIGNAGYLVFKKSSTLHTNLDLFSFWSTRLLKKRIDVKSFLPEVIHNACTCTPV